MLKIDYVSFTLWIITFLLFGVLLTKVKTLDNRHAVLIDAKTGVIQNVMPYEYYIWLKNNDLLDKFQH